jgi:hypothetical protein
MKFSMLIDQYILYNGPNRIRLTVPRVPLSHEMVEIHMFQNPEDPRMTGSLSMEQWICLGEDKGYNVEKARVLWRRLVEDGWKRFPSSIGYKTLAFHSIYDSVEVFLKD